MGKLSAGLWIAVAMLFTGSAAAGDPHIYKWVDSQGVIHYSDHAPAKAQPDLKLMTLPALPAPDAQAIAADQAWIASIGKWYQSVVQQRQQEEYLDLLAAEQAEPAPPPSPPEETVAYVAPYWNYSFGFRFHRHRHFRPLLSPPSPTSFHTSLWNTRPNPFTQQLYKP